MNKNTDVLIIGGGASGLLSAIEIKKRNPDKRVLIVEQNKRVGKKILLTGNGKCNLSNAGILSSDYYTSCSETLDYILICVMPKDVISSFGDIGLLCRQGSQDRVYPYSENASSVLDALRFEIERLGVDVLCENKVVGIEKKDEAFLVKTDKTEIESEKLVIACGGLSCPKTGSDGSLFPILSDMSLKVNTMYPALCPVVVKEKYMLSILNGVRVRARVYLHSDDYNFAINYGEVQFRKDSISGICVFDTAKYVGEYAVHGTVAGKRVEKLYLDIDIFPDMPAEDLYLIFDNRVKHFPNVALDDLSTAFVNKNIFRAVMKSLGLNPSMKAEAVKEEELRAISEKLKEIRFTPIKPHSFEMSQATAGGLCLSEFKQESLEHKRIKNLYAVGEALDVVGNCGGFNLHFAWVSAIHCAKNIFPESKGEVYYE